MKVDCLYRRAFLPVVLGTMLVVSGSAGSQPQTQAPAPTIIRPPTSNGTTDDPPKFRMFFTVLVIGVLLLGANGIPSKRGHQD